MKFNLVTRLGASYDITENPLNPDTPVTPDTPDNPPVPTTGQYLYTGFLPTETITEEQLKSLSIKILIDEKTETIQYPNNEEGYIWFCSTKPITSILDIYRFPVDYYLSGSLNAKLDDESSLITFYCYRTTYDLVSSSWTFTIGF
jgi:hypothetical protein